MRTRNLILRGFVERKGDVWQAFCLELSLAAQGETLEEAKEKLNEQIKEYIFDALAGEDKAHADYLLTRSAPASLWAKYYCIWLACRLSKWFDGSRRPPRQMPFTQPMPLAPAC